jgi:hypothetical protein
VSTIYIFQEVERKQLLGGPPPMKELQATKQPSEGAPQWEIHLIICLFFNIFLVLVVVEHMCVCVCV